MAIAYVLKRKATTITIVYVHMSNVLVYNIINYFNITYVSLAI
jgi:hypothetical protein